MAISEETRAAVARVWESILDAVATCELTLEQAALKLAGVGVRSVQRYARETPGARKALDEALLDGAELMVARIPDLILATPDARRARILAEFHWKLAASRDPSRFGQQSRVTMDVRSIDLTSIIRDANARLAAARTERVIEHEAQGALPTPGASEVAVSVARAALESML